VKKYVAPEPSVVLRDRRVIPVGDLAGEDFHDRLAGQPEVGDQLPADVQVVHERGSARGVRHVGVSDLRMLGTAGIEGIRAVAERRVGGGEVHLLLHVIRAARGRAVRIEVDHYAVGVQVFGPLHERHRTPA
jgi:hypothetical protein